MILSTAVPRIAGPIMLSLAVLLATAGGLPGPASAAERDPGAQGRVADEPQVSGAVVRDALGKTGKAARAVDRFLTADAAGPGEVARRASALIRALGVRRAGDDGDRLLDAVDRVLGRAALALARTGIMRLGIEAGFTPSERAIAMDFGPTGAGAAAGFERVGPDDPRLSGRTLGASRLADDEGVLSDGVTGVERIELRVATGAYRVVLMTQDLSGSAVSAMPFGSEVRINGVPLRLSGFRPQSGSPHALLARGGLSAAGASAAQPPVATGGSGVHAIRQGGAVVVDAHSGDGRLVIELRGFQRARSYLTGLLVEPRDRPSDLMLRPDVADRIVPLDLRRALESEILATAAVVIEALAPGAGRAPPGGLSLPEPEYERADVVSEN